MYDMMGKLKAPNIMILFLIISMKGNIPSVAPMASCLDSAQSQEPMRRLHTYCLSRPYHHHCHNIDHHFNYKNRKMLNYFTLTVRKN